MKPISYLFTPILGAVLCCIPAHSQAKAADSPLTEEQTQVYHDFLAQYSNGAKSTLNLANVTFVLQPDDGDYNGCMKGFTPMTSPKEVHRFDDSFGANNHVKVIDPARHKTKDPGEAIRKGESVDKAVEEGFASGVLSLSQVIFDSGHDRAVLRYSFYCGRLCAQSETVVMEKHKGVWTRAKVSCGYSIS